MEKKQAKQSQFIMLFFAFSFGMVLSNLLGRPMPVSGEDGSSDVETMQEIPIVYRGVDRYPEDLPKDIASKLKDLDQQYESERAAYLEDAALRFHLHELASRKGLDLDAAAEQLFGFAPPTEAEIEAYYKQNQDIIQKPYYQVKSTIEKRVSLEKAKRVRQQILADLKAEGNLVIHLK